METKLNGNTLIKKIIRPPRIAFVVSSLAEVEMFIRIASQSWGGRYFLAIPYAEKGISEDWFDVIAKHNPDHVYTFCEISPYLEERLWRSRFKINEINEKTQLEIGHLYDPVHHKISSPEFFGQPLINLLMLDDFIAPGKEKLKLDYIPLELGFNLYYKAKYGVIDQNEWYGWQLNYVRPEYIKTNLADVFDSIHFSTDQDILTHIHQNRYKNPEHEHQSLIDYTATRLGHAYRDSIFSQPKSETNQIIIVSKEENIIDFCWYWAIRGQRIHPYGPFENGPLWIDETSLLNKYDLVQDLFVNRKNIYIISKSTSENDLPKLSDGWSFQKENLNEFYNGHYFIGAEEDVFVQFDDNEAQFKFTKNDALTFYDFGKQQEVCFEIQIPGFIFPQIRTTTWGNYFIPDFEVTKSGLRYRHHSNREEIKKIIIPTPWDVVSTIASIAGYTLELSDKGRVGNELIRLLGGEENIWPITHFAVLDLFREMSNTIKISRLKELVRKNVQDCQIQDEIIKALPRKSLKEKNLSYSEIRKFLKEKGLDDTPGTRLLKWLLDKDLVRQGKTIRCPTCFTDNWVPINGFNSTVICNGCLNEMKNPFGIDRIDWDYQINSLVSAEIDQGLLVHLFTGYYILEQTQSNFPKNNIYGSYYGLSFPNKTGGRGKEVDIAFIIDGQLIIGECKVSGRALSEQDMQDFMNFAMEIHASKVIFSCIEGVEEIRGKINNIKVGEIEVMVLGKEEILCQYPGVSTENEIMGQFANKPPIDKYERYKELLIHYL